MKQYVIDQLRPQDYINLKTHLDAGYPQAGLPGIYRISIDPGILTQNQLAHTECHPYYFAIELNPNAISCELLVRSSQKLRCICMGYATKSQRDWLIDWIDAMMNETGVRV
jgi:hypothetical protein